MKDSIKACILDFQQSPLPSFYARQHNFKPMLGKALTLIGMRRTGKSTLLMQLIAELLQSKADMGQVVYLNFVDERLRSIQAKDLGLILEAYNELFPDQDKPIYYFFDEIQYIEAWEFFVERVLRMPKAHVYLTGSSAKMLSTEIASAMRGRSLVYEVFPFSFTEYLGFNKIDFHHISTKQKARITQAFAHYRSYGGFPEVLSIPDNQHRMILQDYYRTVLTRDMIERHNADQPKLVGEVMRSLTQQVAGLYTLNKLGHRLKSLGYRFAKSELGEIVDWMNDAFYFYPITIFSQSIAKQNTNPKKGYLIDNGIIRALQFDIFENHGRLLENLVFMELRRQHPEIFYYKTRAGEEVDFVFKHQRQLHLIQVCETLRDPDTEKREVKALAAAMKELGVKVGTILTADEEKTIAVEKGSIRVWPVWRYLLDNPKL